MSNPFHPVSIFSGWLRSYGHELRDWIGTVEKNYVAATAFAAAGLVFLTVSFFIATAALFSILEARLGLYIAYGIVGGAFFLFGAIAAFVAAALFKRRLPPFPSARRQTDALKRSIAAPAATRFIVRGARSDPGIDPVTQIIAGVAAALLIGWIVAPHMRRLSARRKDRR
jgi:hypothetical protein